MFCSLRSLLLAVFRVEASEVSYKRRFVDRLRTKAANGGLLWKNQFLKISQYSQENTYVGVFILLLEVVVAMG